MKTTSKRLAAALCALTLAVGMTSCGKTENETSAANGAAESTAQTTEETKTEETASEAEKEAEEKTETEEKSEDVKSGELNIGEAADNVAAKLDEVKKAANGELEGGYSASMTYIPSSDVTAEVPGLKPITVSCDAKQKDKLTGINYAIEFDSKPVVSLQMVADSSTETGYVVVPELSDGVLTASADDIQSLVNKNMQAPMAAVQGADGQAVETPKFDVEALGNIDYEALGEDLASYVDTIKENFPEPTDGGEYELSAESVTIPLTIKTYTLTEDDKNKLVTAVTDKLKADDQLKKIFGACGMDDAKYNEVWDSAVSGTDTSGTTSFDVYYNGEVPAGIAVKDENGAIGTYAIFANDDSHIIVDCDFGNQTEEATCKGLLTYVDNTINGTVKVHSKTQYSETNGTVDYKDLYSTEDTVRGGIVMTVEQDGEEMAKIDMSFDVNEDGGKITEKVSAQGKDAGTLDMTLQKTDASDIKIPEGKTYKAVDEDELQAYLEGCDVEAFKEKIKAAVGDELFDQMFPQAQASEQSDDEAGTVTGSVKTSKNNV